MFRYSVVGVSSMLLGSMAGWAVANRQNKARATRQRSVAPTSTSTPTSEPVPDKDKHCLCSTLTNLARDHPAWGIAIVPLKPINLGDNVSFGEAQKPVLLRPYIPPLDLAEVPIELRSEKACLMALQEEEATGVLGYCGYLSAKSWQICHVPETVLTEEMVKISVEKGCKLDKIPEKFHTEAIKKLALEVEKQIMAWAPEGDPYI